MRSLPLYKIARALLAPVLIFSTGYAAAKEPSGFLEQSWGLVLVDQGQGYVNAHNGMDLADGDRLLTMESSGGVVVYEGGCAIQLVENSVLALNNERCERDEVAFKSVGPYFAAAIGIVTPKTATDANSSPEKAVAKDASEPAQELSTKPMAAENSGLGISKQTIAIGAGVAALLAAVAGGGGGGSSSTPQH